MSDTEKKDQFVPISPSAHVVANKHSTKVDIPAESDQYSTSGIAIAGLVTSFFIPLLGLVLSIIGMQQTKDNKRGGRGMAIAGVVISSIGLVVGLLFFVLIFLAVITADNKSNYTSTTNSSIASDTETEPTRARLGEKVRDGDAEFTVTSYECGKSSVGEGFGTVPAVGEFCLINISVTNTGNFPIGMYTSNQYLFALTGKKYTADSSASYSVNETSMLWLENIKPGQTVEGTAVYDLPKLATPAYVELHEKYQSKGVLVELK